MYDKYTYRQLLNYTIVFNNEYLVKYIHNKRIDFNMYFHFQTNVLRYILSWHN